MNPILLGRQVRDGLKDLVRSSFESSSPAFDGVIEDFVAREKSFVQGPFVSVDLPFRLAESAGEPFQEIPLGFLPFIHQERAFDRLKGDLPRSLIIATGTGSGKTESYLWPILEACRRRRGEPGVKAIIIYPMNALATDQARRIAKAIDRNPSLKGVRCGLYADAEPDNASDQMSATDVITKRSAMWRDPPDILLTNYKMLDYLLLRARDKELWSRNGPDTLRFLVVDELHTFDGAQAADLALLIRRLKARLKTPAGHLACVGSSATLGAGEEATRRILGYAEEVFGEPFEADATIREDRFAAAEVFGDVEYPELPGPERLEAAITSALLLDQAQAALAIARAFFPEFDPGDEDFDPSLPQDPAQPAWRLALGDRLRQHIAAQRVVGALGEIKGPADLADVVAILAESRLFRRWSPEALRALVEGVLVMIAWARQGSPEAMRPLFNLRVQLWTRELARMVCDLPRIGDDGQRTRPQLNHSDDLDWAQLSRMLPLVHCGQCGTGGHLGRLSQAGGGSLGADLRILYDEFFEGSQRLRVIFHDPVSRLGGAPGHGAVITGHLNADTLEFVAGPHADEPAPGPVARVWLYDPTTADGKVDRTCPACGSPQGMQIVGLRAARLTASLTTTLFNSEHHETDAKAKPRVLMFSDSVQDAAQRAAVAEIRNFGVVVRKALYRSIDVEARTLNLEDVTQRLPSALRAEAGEDVFVARFIARDQAWREQYETLCATDQLGSRGHIAKDVELRLGWEFFSDLTYRSHTSQTLESARLAVADPDPEAVSRIALRLPEALEAHVVESFAISKDHAYAFAYGVLRQMRKRGAIGHNYVRLAIENANERRGLNFTAAQAALGVLSMGVLPRPDARTGAAPVPPTLRSGIQGFESVVGTASTNWYRDWADRFFLERDVLARSKYGDVFGKFFELCEADGIVRKIVGTEQAHRYGWVLNPAKVIVSADVSVLRCDTCRRQETVLSSYLGRSHTPCGRIGCTGSMGPIDGRTTGSEYMRGLFRTDRNHRVVAREHTGILETNDRRALERGFIEGEHPWNPNVVSATPTLEMGIDIGDLSTLLLCSVPPEEANYVQRIGRTGRRDGNSLNLTIATARPHDLQFWEDPASMLAGQVGAPGVYLEALAVLRRQAAAYSLDCLIADSDSAADYPKVRDVLATLEAGTAGRFPLDWFAYLEKHGGAVAANFVSVLPAAVRARAHIVEDLQAYLAGEDQRSLRWIVRARFDEAATERDGLKKLQDDIDAQRRRLQRQSPPPKDLQELLDALKRERGEISHTIRVSINDKRVLQFLTDQGILPNYAFPEEGVKLKSIIAKRTEPGPAGERARDSGSNLVTREYIRPAATALSEFAPQQTFYSEGRQVEIDRIDLQARDIETWRFCPNCAHTDPEPIAKLERACPKCKTPMWEDVGATADAIQLKTVIAVTSEQKASIRDSDERQQRHFDRQVFPSYDLAAIAEAFATDPNEDVVPFGYEFISHCEFRDVNFGVSVQQDIGQTIAGRQRRSEPFRICRKCGRIQTRRAIPGEPGEHLSRCEVNGTDLDRADWQASAYLMRSFATEAIRVVMPVSGQANDDEIKSFVAGVELGMRKHFAGKIDHIRSAVVEEKLQGQASVRSLYLYDSVPGGSGYLRQMAEDPRTMQGIFRRAAEILRDCPCAREGRDGCYRCVKSYRAQFGPGEPRRDTALQFMEGILANWEKLKKVETSINETITASVVESVLEGKFLDALRKEFGADSLKPTLAGGASRAFQLAIKDGGEPVFWLIEPQVQIDKRIPGAPRKRVDFLLTPAGATGVKPIVVEMDGWEYHAHGTAADLQTRILLLRTGKLGVWSLNWEDMDGASTQPVANPFADGHLSAASEGALAALWKNPLFSALHDQKSRVAQFRTGRAFDALVSRLRTPGETGDLAAAIPLRVALGPSGAPLDDLPGVADLDPDAHSFLAEGGVHGRFGDRGLVVYVGAPSGQPVESMTDLPGYRVVLAATITITDQPAQAPQDTRATWRGLWRLLNLLQDLPGLHVVFPGLDNLSAPAVNVAPFDPLGEAWGEAADLADEAVVDLVAALRAAAAPTPDMLGEDVLTGDAVVGQIEFGWKARRVGIALSPLHIDGWTVIHIDPEAPEPLSAVLDAVLSAISEC
jgi:DEAD/DEAH box helicase domain-containing protein